jgi:ribosomal protein L15E
MIVIVSKLCFDSAEDNTSVRGQYQYQRIIPVSEDNTGIRGQYRYQRTIPVSEDNTSIRGQYQHQWTIPVSENNTSIRGQYQYQKKSWKISKGNRTFKSKYDCQNND